MPKSTLVCKDTALLEFADPANTFFQKIVYMQLRGQSFEELDAAKASRKVDRQFGKIRNNGQAYLIKFDSDLFTLAELQTMLNTVNAVQARIVEVIDYPMFVAIPDADYNTNTPQYLPNSRVAELDGEGNPVLDGNGDPVITKIKWDEWKDANHEHLAVAGINYIPLNAHTGANDALSRLQ